MEKSEAALIAAIEIFNKPDFHYREETFALLALNAWELLVKAKVLAESGGHVRALYSYETRATKKGPGQKRYVKRNRAGNPLTIGLDRCVNVLTGTYSIAIDDAVRANIEALTEVRDNAAHFMNASPRLARIVLELGSATLRNYVTLLRSWFKRDLSQYNLYLMPLGFVNATAVAGLPTDAFERQLVNYLADTITKTPTADSDYNVALTVELTFQRSKADGAVAVKFTNDPAAPKVQVTEEDIRAKYPWDHAELVRRLKQRYSDFAPNNKFYGLKKGLMADDRYCKSRFLDPAKPTGIKKDFYSPNIVNELDVHYTLK